MNALLGAPWLDPAPHTVLRLALALLLLAAMVHKLGSVGLFRAALAGYALLPERAITPAAALIIAAELVIGITVALPATGAVPALAAAALLSVYSAAIAITLLRGRRDRACGCSGPAGHLPLSGGLLARNVVLIVLSLACAFAPTTRPLMWLDSVTIVGGLLTLSFLYGAMQTALANAPKRPRRDIVRDVAAQIGEFTEPGSDLVAAQETSP